MNTGPGGPSTCRGTVLPSGRRLCSRRAAFFTNVNPAIDLAGFFGERKSAILSGLPAGELSDHARDRCPPTAQDPMALVLDSGYRPSLIVKPDVGERGDGVTLVSSEPGAPEGADRTARGPHQPQALAPGEHEFGLFFARDQFGKDDLLSITRKATSCRDRRWAARCRNSPGPPGQPPVEGCAPAPAHCSTQSPRQDGPVRVEPIGNHWGTLRGCRTPSYPGPGAGLGTTDGNHHRQYYGRMDVRCTDEDALRAGGFMLIEVNR